MPYNPAMPIPNTTTVFYTVAQAAQRLAVDESTVRRWIRLGLLPGTERTSPRRRAEYRIPDSAITEFEEARRKL
jgi:excisionase family DNA binding protein